MVRKAWQLSFLAILITSPTILLAGSPVSFDVGFLTAAEDVTSPEFEAARPGYRLMQVEVMISTMVDSRISEDLVETTFFIEPHNPRIQIEDFSPQTTLQSPYAGNISKEKRIEYDISSKLGANSKAIPNLGTDGSLGITRKQSNVERADLLPELKLVSASGTIHRGRGVYFRFNRSPQSTLEGTTVLGVILAVPERWSADTMTIRCEAKVRERIVPGAPSSETNVPQQRYTVATYRAGDKRAAQLAERYIREEANWHQVKHQYADEIRGHGSNNPLELLTSLVRRKKSYASAEQWFAAAPEEAAKQLPAPVVESYYRLQEAKARLDTQNGLGHFVSDEGALRQPIANSSQTIPRIAD